MEGGEPLNSLQARPRARGLLFVALAAGGLLLWRLHLDAMPFSKALTFDLELWHWSDTTVRWSSVAYYYARPGSRARD